MEKQDYSKYQITLSPYTYNKLVELKENTPWSLTQMLDLAVGEYYEECHDIDTALEEDDGKEYELVEVKSANNP